MKTRSQPAGLQCNRHKYEKFNCDPRKANSPGCSNKQALWGQKTHPIVETVPFQCYFPFNHCLMSDTAGFTYTEVSNIIYSAFNTEYTSSDSLLSHWICMCFMLGPEWICMAKTRFQWDKGSLESWTVFLLKKKKLLFTFLLPAGLWGRREAVWAGRSHHISLSSVTLGDTMLLNSIFCPFFSLCVGLYC